MEKLVSKGVLDLLWNMATSNAADTGDSPHLIYGRLVAHHVSKALLNEHQKNEGTE